ncbi:MAG: glycosyltransferase, partial [Acidimicrobiia bacterium]|nr:glycosyltransferase [Acidimicrobiia bacterium]
MSRAIVISHSFLERDPRVSRAVEALVDAGWQVDGLFLDEPKRTDRLRTWQVPIGRQRGSALRYVLEYGAFFLWSFFWIGHRSFWHTPDVIYINSPPDFLAFAGALGKLRGIPVILDVHDPMPELFVAKGKESGLVTRALGAQEKWSAKFADRVVTVHEPLRDLLQTRSPEVDMDIVMNVPDTSTWPDITPNPDSRTIVYTGSIAVRYG